MGIAAHQERMRRMDGRIHRPGEETEVKRNERKMIGKSTWYKPWAKEPGIFKTSRERTERKRKREDSEFPTGRKKVKKKEVAAVMTVERTTNGLLAKGLREKERELSQNSSFSVKIVEKPGSTLSNILITSHSIHNCKRNNCNHCSSKETKRDFKKNCMRSNILYKVTCKRCKEEMEEGWSEDEKKREEKKDDDDKTETLYIGESSKSMYRRSLQHTNKVKSLQSDSFILRHMIHKHPSVLLEDMIGSFKFSVLEYHQKALERMVAESTEIKRMINLETKTILNSKLEYNRTIIHDISESPISPEELEREKEIDEKAEHLRKERREKQKRRRVETSEEE